MLPSGENDKPKEIVVGASTVLNLRAELAKKEAQFMKERAKIGNSISTAQLTKWKVDVKKNKNLQSNKGVAERSMKDEAEMDQGSVLEASARALERKAQIYNQLKNSNKDIPENDNLLVDFLIKNVEEDLDEQPRRKKRLWMETKPVKGEELNWIEITDEFGRTRLVRRNSELAKQAMYIEF
jgi:hypothetical protein